MKKTYNSPKAQVIKLRTKHVMAASNPQVTVNPNDNVDAANVEVKRGGRGLWDQEW